MMTILCCLIVVAFGPGGESPLPKVAEGWTIKRVAQAPDILFPTAIVAAADGTIYLGQDPMDMPGPPTKPIDSVVAIKEGKVRVFADGLWAVMGLEWADGTLYVVHAPYLSAFTDTDGDGRADRRVDLMTGLGPPLPGFSGINDHVASGMRLGIDGFLYIAIGDKGIPRGVGRDGTTIRLKGGGVIRIRPDGTGLEIVSTGERNPLSAVLTDRDDVFTYGNDDDSRKWPNSLTHHIVGGHYGYPYEFLNTPWRSLPVVAGVVGGSGTQATFFNEDGLPARYRGNLFVTDWGLQTVFRYELVKSGATFKVARQEAFVTKGDLADFRPFSIAVDADRSSLLLVDWAYMGWLADGPKTGRLYRLRYVGSDKVEPTQRKPRTDPLGCLADLDHPALSVRRDAQRALARYEATVALAARLQDERNPSTGRIHALWSLDDIGSQRARTLIRSVLTDPDPSVRLQAARSVGIHRDRGALAMLAPMLKDADPAARREAAIALGKIGDKSAGPALFASLGDRDPFVAWSVRTAIRRLNAWSTPAMVEALGDPKRHDDALMLADESWSPPAMVALSLAYKAETDPSIRSRLLGNIAGQYRKYPDWSGNWFGTNPLAGEFPAKTVDWDPAAMGLVLDTMAAGLADPDASVRRQAIIGLNAVGPKVTPLFRLSIPKDADETNRSLMVATLGRWGDAESVPLLTKLLNAPDASLAIRSTALDALAGINTRPAATARLMVLYDPKAPPELVARALPSLGRSGSLPPNDLAAFLIDKPKSIRLAAMLALSGVKTLPSEVTATILRALDDPDLDIRAGAIDAVARLGLRDATPTLIRLAGDPATNVEATRALAIMPDPRALDVYLNAMVGRNPDLRGLGETALLRVRDGVRDELTKRARAETSPGVASRAAGRVLAEFRPIVNWRVIGPFARTTAEVFVGEPSIDFTKVHSGVEGRPIAWTPRAADPTTGRVSIDDFKAGRGDKGGFGYDTTGSPDLAAFATTEIVSDRDRPAMLLVGSSGSVLATLNEKKVHSYSNVAGRGYVPDTDLVRINLTKGTNRLLLRVRQGIGTWSFSVKLSDPLDPSFATAPAVVNLETLRSFAIGHAGDTKKGEELFFDAKGLACLKCHAANGRGSSTLGPDLTGLALKYDMADIIQSVLIPSARLATGYQPVTIARADGTVVSGLIRSETATEIEMVDAEARVTRVAKSEVEDRKVSDISLMPTGLVDTLSPVDFADLIAYLTSLKSAPKPPAR